MSRIYANCKEALGEIKRNLYEMGIEVWPHSYQNKNIKDDENFQTKELQGECFSIVDTSDRDELVGKNLEWCKAEFKERIGPPVNPGEAWKLREHIWKQFLDKDGKHDYTYSERMSYQVQPVIDELKRNPDTRQAVIEVHNNQIDLENIGGKKRICCSMFYQAMIRKDGEGIPKLNMIYVMRSCDYYCHFRNDIWLACELQKYIAEQVGVEVGQFTMFISSLHMFRKDMEEDVY